MAWADGIGVATPAMLGFAKGMLESPGEELHRLALSDYFQDEWGDRGYELACLLRRPGHCYIKRLSAGRPVELYWDAGDNHDVIVAAIQRRRYPRCFVCEYVLRPLRDPPMFVATREMMIGTDSGWLCYPKCR